MGPAGSDVLSGGLGKDDVLGGNLSGPKGGGSKVLYGGPGNDFLGGGLGSDVLYGSTGKDLLIDGEASRGPRDVLYGGTGNDTFFPRNEPGGLDVVSCGGGYDVVYADRADVIAGDCEIPPPSGFLKVVEP